MAGDESVGRREFDQFREETGKKLESLDHDINGNGKPGLRDEFSNHRVEFKAWVSAQEASNKAHGQWLKAIGSLIIVVLASFLAFAFWVVEQKIANTPVVEHKSVSELHYAQQ